MTVGGRSAPVISLPNGDANSVEVQLPVELTPGPATMLVSNSAGTAAAVNLTLEQYSPGLFPFLQIVHAPGGANSGCYGNLAAPGDTVSVYATGLGATNPVVGAGQAAPASPLAVTLVMPAVTIGGQAAEVVESVLAPGGSIGQYRVSFKVPAGSGPLGAVVSIGGRSSNPVPVPVGTGFAFSNFLTVQAASWAPGPAAPESLMVAHSCGLPGLTNVGDQGIVGDALKPPLTLGGATVKVQDSAGVERAAPILYVNSYQANYQIPTGTAMGPAKVTITSAEGTVSTAGLDIQQVSPGIFQAALLERYSKGSASFQPVQLAISAAQGIAGQLGSPVIDLGAGADDVYLILFGTGLRFRSSLDGVSATFGGVDVPVEYAGPQNQFPGLDQVNLRLPKSLAGLSGPLNLMVNGKAANVAFLNFQ